MSDTTKQRSCALVCSIGVALSILAFAVRADVIVNNPAADAGVLNGFTQSGSSTIAFGSTVLVIFNDSGSNVSPTANFAGYARSTDGGLTFTDMGALPAQNFGFSHLARSTASGTVYTTALPSSTGMLVFRSTDGGLTFGAPISILPGTVPNFNAIAVDNNAGAGNGNVYVVSEDFSAAGGCGGQCIRLTRSTDGGLTFGPGVLVATGSRLGPSVAVAPDHSVTVGYLDQTGGVSTIRTSRSTDGGITFGPSVIAAAMNNTTLNGDLGLTGVRSGTSTPANFRSNGHPQVVANPITGQLYMVYADNPVGADKADVFLVASNDNGATWGAPQRMNTDAGINEQWQPTLAISPNGLNLGVFWYDRRLDPTDNLIDYFGRQCGITGLALSCGADFRVSDQSFLPEFGRDSFVSPTYMGDYDNASADNSFFYVSWGDNLLPLGTTGRNDPNVFFDRVAIEPNGVVVPEPVTLALLLFGLSALGLERRRHTR